MTFTLLTVAALSSLVLFALMFAAKQYRRCASDEILVIFGKVRGGKTAECIHGGGKLVLPLIQDYKYLSLRPMPIEVPLKGALSKNNIRVNVPATFTTAISTDPNILQNAAERLLNLTKDQIVEQARDIITGQLRLSIANMTIEEINKDRDKFLTQVNTNVTEELHKIGLTLINVNIQDLTDQSGYIDAIGRKAAAEATQNAIVDVAQQERQGAIGVANATREKQVQVATQQALTVEGENESRAKIADYNASLAEKEAEARRRSEVAKANAARDVSLAQKDAQVAELQKAELAKQEVEKQKVEVNASAEASKSRLLAEGEADAIRAKYAAEAEGIEKVLTAKAEGYKKLVSAAGKPELASTLLMIEKLKDVVSAQAEMVKNIKIDKITVWDSGKGETSNFLQQFSKFLPPFHELAAQAGVSLPNYLGTVQSFDEDPTPAPTGGGSTNGSGSATTAKLSANGKGNGAVRQ